MYTEQGGDMSAYLPALITADARYLRWLYRNCNLFRMQLSLSLSLNLLTTYHEVVIVATQVVRHTV